MPDDQPPRTTESCPGCGAVLVPLTSDGPSHPGASASCARLFEVTLRGLREEAAADPATAPVVALADAAYEAQHPVRGEEGRLHRALELLGVPLGTAAGPETEGTPRAWRTTVADVAADLDVIDLSVLVESWARAVHEDWSGDPAIGKQRNSFGPRRAITTFCPYADTVGDLSGRRARKKAQTREHVRAVAQRLFGERGFDTVTIADIAREADVAVQTVFNHFATKEELFFDGRTPWVDGPAAAVCSRAPGVPALSALRIHLVETVRAHVGSYSTPEGRCYLATLEASDTLRVQERELVHEAERRLHAALLEAWNPATEAAPADPEATAPLVAAIWLAASRSLIVEQRAQLTAGADPAQVATITAGRADRMLGELEKTVEPAPERHQTGAGSPRHLASAGTAIGTRTSSTTRSTCSAVIAPSPAAM